jgi:ribosomal protein S18 acetylase RimI-like enzyme
VARVLPAQYVVEPLAVQHDRSTFSCGRVELDSYLRERAGQDARRRVAAPYVAVAPGSVLVAGYYTLSSLGIALGQLPANIIRRLPRYPQLPATLLGRLAVDTRHQGKRLGEVLLLDALARSLEASRRVASVAVVVDAIDDGAQAFYRHFEFISFPEQRRRLFLPMKAIEILLGRPRSSSR